MYVTLLHYFKFLSIGPHDGPKGPKRVVYMKIHSCVGQYVTARSSIGCPPSS